MGPSDDSFLIGEGASPQQIDKVIYDFGLPMGPFAMADLAGIDIDMVWLNGHGFPAYRGGPMFYGETVGLKKICDKICEFRDKHGAKLWEPSPLLKRLAEGGKGFSDI